MLRRKSSSAGDMVPRAQLVELYRAAVLNGTSLHEIDKRVDRLMTRSTVTAHREEQDDTQVLTALSNKVPWFVRWGALAVPAVMMVIGTVLLGNAVIPIFQAYMSGSGVRQASSMVAPVPPQDILDINPLVIGLAQAEESSATRSIIEPIVLDNELDYTNLSNWFSTNEAARAGLTIPDASASAKGDEYIIDIPKLKITNAVVKVGGTDLNNNLIQYPGTALPGESGSPVIFGHSVLRQFYNPSEQNSRRYTSLFSTIMTLQRGDQIFVTHQGVKYTYVVQDKLEVKPEDTYILNQRHDSSQLKLVTCVPEGTFFARGVVVAELLKN